MPDGRHQTHPTPQPAAETTRAAHSRPWSGGWPLERVLFLVAGAMTGVSAALAAAVTPWFLILTGFVAANQLLYAAIGTCGMAAILRRTTNLVALGSR